MPNRYPPFLICRPGCLLRGGDVFFIYTVDFKERVFDNIPRREGTVEQIVGVLETIDDPELLHLIYVFVKRLAGRKEQEN